MDTRETMHSPSVNSPRSQEWFAITSEWQDRLAPNKFDSVWLERYREYSHAESEVETYREYGDRTNYYTIVPFYTTEQEVFYDLYLWRPKSD
jgi:hypothetical protein